MESGNDSAVGMSECKPSLLRKPSIILIDDCPDYRLLMQTVSQSLGVSLSSFGSLAEMHSLALFRKFDVAIIDYCLGTWNGIEIAQYIDIFFREIPVIMISGSHLPSDSLSWPQCVRHFMHKSSGAKAILQQVINTYGRVQLLKLVENSYDH